MFLAIQVYVYNYKNIPNYPQCSLSTLPGVTTITVVFRTDVMAYYVRVIIDYRGLQSHFRSANYTFFITQKCQVKQTCVVEAPNRGEVMSKLEIMKQCQR